MVALSHRVQVTKIPLFSSLASRWVIPSKFHQNTIKKKLYKLHAIHFTNTLTDVRNILIKIWMQLTHREVVDGKLVFLAFGR